MKTPIHDFLTAYAASDNVRCHTPGHKGNGGFLNALDITEIKGADCLYKSAGIIRESENNAASLFGSARTLYSCSGATLAVSAMLYAAVKVGGKKRITASRYSHKCLVNAAVLLGADIDWVYPEAFLSCVVTPASVREAIFPDTAGVFINSLDYYGGTCDIEAIAQICREKHIPLLVDNAHGAYLAFRNKHPLQRGATLCADGGHKTLPVLTGGAYLHIADDCYTTPAEQGMALFGTSSPSYLILDSLDLCNRHIACGREQAEAAFNTVAELKAGLLDAGYRLRESDDLRVTIDANAYGYDGTALADAFAENGVICEMSDRHYTVLLFSTITGVKDISRVLTSVRKIPQHEPVAQAAIAPVKAQTALLPRTACFSASVRVRVSQAGGRVCAAVEAPTPPCVPLVLPGEVITGEVMALLNMYGIEEIEVMA